MPAPIRSGPRRIREGTALTDRELQVLTLAACGYNTRQTARQLHITEDTVKTLRSRSYRRLGAYDATDAVVAALARGDLNLQAVIDARAARRTPTDPRSRAMSTEPTEQQLTDLPQLAVACPRCASPAGQLCTSHQGTRVRHHTVHQARHTAWADQPPPPAANPRAVARDEHAARREAAQRQINARLAGEAGR
ncbi:LuxR C-terminal-related transcriptional regulator [Streptomycetaceae bacterium NBC_01309]